ncbi:MAG: hypothetical protein N4A33_06270 [Bacteriovoracaceae bacterium]|jgi:hypothetical protein|nr:hypothetical protein [Bacteriovoracaceae bacterium]
MKFNLIFSGLVISFIFFASAFADECRDLRNLNDNISKNQAILDELKLEYVSYIDSSKYDFDTFNDAVLIVTKKYKLQRILSNQDLIIDQIKNYNRRDCNFISRVEVLNRAKEQRSFIHSLLSLLPSTKTVKSIISCDRFMSLFRDVEYGVSKLGYVIENVSQSHVEFSPWAKDINSFYEMYLENNEIVNCRGYRNNTPLLHASGANSSRNISFEVASFLIANGADVNTKNGFQSPLGTIRGIIKYPFSSNVKAAKRLEYLLLASGAVKK